ncbi:hypothetical protein [Novilysobacter erysipheiresistens]|uniref:Uncharacterized protein n=1 Tax=Novilysobacter erysipheiresistens TaxID=1749332 RepID=A0ABU7YUL8_9GAMM
MKDTLLAAFLGAVFGLLILLAMVGMVALTAWHQVGPDGAAACLQAAYTQPEPPQ